MTIDKLNNITAVENCTGCGLCSFVCPKSAIVMKENLTKDHFIYPSIDTTKCIGCGICFEKCPSTCCSNKNVDYSA